jgi:vacuolar-type H+-ATPase subunit E/Vma4
MANISRAAQEKAKAAVKGKAEEEVKKLTEKAPQQIKDVLKGIFK